MCKDYSFYLTCPSAHATQPFFCHIEQIPLCSCPIRRFLYVECIGKLAPPTTTITTAHEIHKNAITFVCCDCNECKTYRAVAAKVGSRIPTWKEKWDNVLLFFVNNGMEGFQHMVKVKTKPVRDYDTGNWEVKRDVVRKIGDGSERKKYKFPAPRKLGDP